MILLPLNWENAKITYQWDLSDFYP